MQRAGTSGNGKGTVELRPCDAKNERQRKHGLQHKGLSRTTRDYLGMCRVRRSFLR